MKRVLRGPEPAALTGFRTGNPRATWDQMRNDALAGGRAIYEEIRRTLIEQQRGLCAYCEIDVRDNDPMKCRVEHFHPKADADPAQNWSLSWDNMLGVCNGGSHPHVAAPGFHLEPIDSNLSCDAHKDRMIQQRLLESDCEGRILDPCRLPAFPSLVRVHRGTGELLPDSPACQQCEPWEGNRHASVEDLVKSTIRMLNLNCDRLVQQRLKIVWNIEKRKKEFRLAGRDPTTALAELAARCFTPEWPAFFSTLRSCLGGDAESHLRSITFQG